jgi:Septum formation
MTGTYPHPPWPPWPPPPAQPNRRPVVLAAVIAAAAGLVVGAVIGAAVMFFVGSLGVFGPDELTRGPGGKLPLFDLAVGQCANGEITDGSSFGSDATVPCSQSHDFEVYASASPPGVEQAVGYPDPRDLAALAGDHCLLALEAFVGSDYDDSDLDYTAIIPSRAAWEAGDRTVLCALWQVDGDSIVGSARGTHR